MVYPNEYANFFTNEVFPLPVDLCSVSLTCYLSLNVILIFHHLCVHWNMCMTIFPIFVILRLCELGMNGIQGHPSLSVFFLIWFFVYLRMFYISIFGHKLTPTNRHFVKCMIQLSILRQQVSRINDVWNSMIWLAELGKTFLQKNCSKLKIAIQNIIKCDILLRITILNFLSQKKMQNMCIFATAISFYKLNRHGRPCRTEVKCENT